MNNRYLEFHEIVNKYDKIIIFTHILPDYDALGSQFGLATYLKDNYKNKKIYCLGDNSIAFSGKIYPYLEQISDDIVDKEKFLAIIVDTSEDKRISDQRYLKSDFIIKIDHHIDINKYGNFEIVESERASAAELVVDILNSNKNTFISKLAAQYFFSGIVGDTGRFYYDSVNQKTFEIAGELLSTGFKLGDIYHPMYMKSIKSLEVIKYIYSIYKITPKGIAYFHLSNNDFERFNIDDTQYKEFIGLFSQYQEIPIWVIFAQMKSRGIIKASIRSRSIAINEVCTKFNGGGHKLAAGANLDNLEQCDLLIAELEKLI